MRLGRPAAGGMLAVLLSAGSPGQLLPVRATPQQQGTTQPEIGQLDEHSQILDEDSSPLLQRADELSAQAIELFQQGRYSEAEPLFLDALVIRREQLGDRHLDVATSLHNLAVLYHAQGRYSEAEPLHLEALAIVREQLGERHPHMATSLHRLASLYQAQGRYSEAEPLYLDALAIGHEQLGEHHPDVAISLNSLAELYQDQGRYSEAEPLFLDALVIRREQLGEGHPDVATSLNSLAELFRDQGRYSEAEPLLLEALVIRREQLGEGHPDVATSLNSLARLYQAQGRYSEAESLHLEALAIVREQLGERHPDMATSLNNLAGLYQDQGRYSEAESLHLDALAIRREQLGEGHPDVATSLNSLALLYKAQGRYSEAEPLLLEALAIGHEQLGERHPNVATRLSNLALLYQTQGRYSEAEPLYLNALAIVREQLGERHPSVATSLHNLALLYQTQGRYSEAEPLYLEALAIFREQLGERHPDVATSLNNLASLYLIQGRYSEAEPLYLNALAIFREQLGEGHPSVAISLNHLAGLYEVKGNLPQAIRSLQAGLAIEEQHLELNLATLAEAQRQAYAATLMGSTNSAISLHLQIAPDNPEATKLALTTLLRRKGRLLESGLNSLQVLRQNLTPEAQAMLDQLTAKRQALAALVYNPPTTLTTAQYQAQLMQLEQDANQLEAALARSSARYQAESTPVEIATLQEQIPAHGVLVEYIRYRPYDATNPANSWGAPRYAAYLLFPDGRVEAVDLGEAAAIDAAVNAFSRELRQGALSVSSLTSLEAATRNLQSRIFDPIAPYLTDLEHLLISPDSELNRIPFEALQTEAGGDYLVQRYQISYLNSGRDLLTLDVTEPSTTPALILANPDYDTADSAVPIAQASSTSQPDTRSLGDNRRSIELQDLEFGPLPGTATEAEAIADVLPNATILTEAQASENILKTVAAPRILHIATHGFFLENANPSSPGSRSGLAVVLDENAPTSAPMGVAVENPLLRSGLALAGFNARSSGDEDGVLTALEAANLNLFGTQLVVLSACDTGLGDIANGEGIYGLRRAFTLAGAETQLMSLWLVSDDGTSDLMARYYDKLTSGMGRGEALRETQLEMIREGERYSHPYYWASFILAGDWRPLE
ncbi:MAG: tetratricopeptide repeat protein [Leptolyngbya sp. SIO1E4]|nr:tetratricopeptide repeat protein [Leptolyngbya sp. SIO1E4]